MSGRTGNTPGLRIGGSPPRVARAWPAIQRILIAALTIWLSTVAIFALVLLIPGDIAVAIAGDSATPDLIAQIHERLRLDVPPVQRYFEWLASALTGDLGTSLLNGREITGLIAPRMGITLSIIGMALLLGGAFGVGVAIVTVLASNRFTKALFNVVTAISLAMPTFWVGMVLIVIFAFGLYWFPAVSIMDTGASPWQNAQALVLPAVAMSFVVGGEVARQAYSSLTALDRSLFVTALRAKGLTRTQIVFGHTLRHCGGIILTVLGVYAARLMGIAVAVEVVFGVAGLGNLLVSSVLVRDIPVIQAVALVIATLVVVVNLATDLVIHRLDPRKATL